MTTTIIIIGLIILLILVVVGILIKRKKSKVNTTETTTETTTKNTTETTTISTTLKVEPVQSIIIARPLSGSQGTIDLCGESPTDGSVTDLSTVDTNVYFRNSSPIPDDGQQLYSDYACEVPYERSLDALWAMKTANGMGVFDYYDLYITLSGIVDGYFSCSPTTTTTVTVQQVYYTLYKCVPNGIDYYTGPLKIGSFQTGDRVEGATDTFYTVSTSTETTPTGTHIDVTGTNLKGC